MNGEAKGRAGKTSSQVAAMVAGLTPRFLEGLDPAEVQTVVAAATLKRFSKNFLMIREGERADHLFLMLDWGARHFTMSPRGEKVVVQWLSPGEVTGAASFLSKPVTYVLSTEAAKNSSALVWDRATIRSLATACPRLMENALMVAYDYVVLFRILQVTLRCQSAPERVAQVLGYLAKEMGQRVPGGLELYVRNEELAHEANVTVFTVSRLMGEWQRKGLLTKSRGKVVVRSPEELIQMEA
jgi:CRP/FNR family transcriptional regulator, nitrogen oxide reductase regulator